tara:strand:- start:3975 stop:4568 length:594 start_codon:yes stop_codon:yes gene_type:complete
MALKTLNLSTLSRKKALSKAIEKTVKIFDNKPCTTISQEGSRAVKIGKMTANLTKSSLTRKPQKENQFDKNMLCGDLLNSMGVSMVEDETVNKANYSLLAAQTDIEILLNPNKIDMSIFREIKKGKVSFQNILKDPNDSFYRLDEAVDNNYMHEQKVIKEQKSKASNQQLNKVVAQIYDMNYSNTRSPNIRSLKGTV